MSGVDVLAVMDRALSACEAHTARTVFVGGDQGFRRVSDNYGIPEARAAVAELIEAGMAATEEKMHDGASSREACDRLVAALSRVRGAE